MYGGRESKLAFPGVSKVSVTECQGSGRLEDRKWRRKIRKRRRRKRRMRRRRRWRMRRRKKQQQSVGRRGEVGAEVEVEMSQVRVQAARMENLLTKTGVISKASREREGRSE